MANRHSSNNDLKFNHLTTSLSNPNSKDLHTSTFSTSKLLDSSQNGPRAIVPTHQYLESIEKKYEQLYQAKEKNKKHQAKHPHEDVSQMVQPQHDIPTKFKQQNHNQPPEVFLPVPGHYPNAQQFYNANSQPNVRSQILESQFQYPRQQPVLNIPNDISLSRGVSERGAKN